MQSTYGVFMKYLIQRSKQVWHPLQLTVDKVKLYTFAIYIFMQKKQTYLDFIQFFLCCF